MRDLTLPQSMDVLRNTLRDYIEATYHIRDPKLIEQRRALLEQPGTIGQVPYVETLPQYVVADESFDESSWLPKGAALAFAAVSTEGETDALGTALPRRIFPPYTHQHEAVKLALGCDARYPGVRRSVVVTTGTGSGKTECFLLPILASLAQQAWEAQPGAARYERERWRTSAVRVIVLYPMNALVNDQLGRLRQWLGDPRLVNLFLDQWKLGRPLLFARYTGRSLYPGVRRRAERKDGKIQYRQDGRPKLRSRDRMRLDPTFRGVREGAVKTIRTFYIKHEHDAEAALAHPGHASVAQHRSLELVRKLRAMGKWPAKPSMKSWFFGKNGQQGPGSRWYADGPAQDGTADTWLRAVRQERDSELFTRHEVQATPPDVLITNYSMLEYMLLRPLERGIFDQTKEFFEHFPSENLLLVVDEAHLYRGTGGAEVALLLRRLRERLGLGPERLQVICTSASFTAEAKGFAAELTGKASTDFDVVRSAVKLLPEQGELNRADLDALLTVDRAAYEAAADDPAARHAAVRDLLNYREANGATVIPPDSHAPDEDSGRVERALHDVLRGWLPVARAFNAAMPGSPRVMPDGRAAGARPFSRLPPGHSQEEHPLTEIVFGELGTAMERERGLTTLLSLATAARNARGEPLLPARAHAFFRGLPGLWVCIDSSCTEVPEHLRGGAAGKLFARDPGPRCRCGARVFPLYTCRDCGAAYARGYTNLSPQEYLQRGAFGIEYLWSKAGDVVFGAAASEDVWSLAPVDLLLEVQPGEASRALLLHSPHASLRWMDLATGRLEGERDYDPDDPEDRRTSGRRLVALPSGVEPDDPKPGRKKMKAATAQPTARKLAPGQFRPCPVCQGEGGFGRSTVMDHETKGEQPFSALVTAQLGIQRPHSGPKGESKPQAERRVRHAPLLGRKVLIFSDSRQKAAGMSIDVNTFAAQDAIRPLLVRGWTRLTTLVPADELTLQHLLVAMLIGESDLSARLRVVDGEAMLEPLDQLRSDVTAFLRNPAKGGERLLGKAENTPVPEALAGILYGALTGARVSVNKAKPADEQQAKQKGAKKLNRVTNLQTLAIGSITERASARGRVGTDPEAAFPELLSRLPELQGTFAAEHEKMALVRLWIETLRRSGIWIPSLTPDSWREGGAGCGDDAIIAAPAERGDEQTKMLRALLSTDRLAIFEREWLPRLREFFLTDRGFLDGRQLTLDVPNLRSPGREWSICRACGTVQRTFHPTPAFCLQCRRPEATALDLELKGANAAIPDDLGMEFAAIESSPAVRWFDSRKRLHRLPILKAALRGERPLIAVAGEHTAQIGDAPAGEIFSPAELNELLFQDIDIGRDHLGHERSAIDVLSCTTTMEVGIDIGSLSGVALRNMPPRRDNYQQRAGRAGRRGDGVATVIAYANNDSHDSRGFERPASMLSDPVIDPWLKLDNPVVVRRHVAAYLLQRFSEQAVHDVPEWAQPQLFEVLGTLTDFLDPIQPISLVRLVDWLGRRDAEEPLLRTRIIGWAAAGLGIAERAALQAQLYEDTLAAIQKAAVRPPVADPSAAVSQVVPEAPEEPEEDAPVDLPGASLSSDALAGLHRSDADRAEDPVPEDLGVDSGPSSAVTPDAEHGRRGGRGSNPDLLPLLIDAGVLPSYAFPTAVVAFHVFGDGHTPRQPRFAYTPSQGLEQALSQYAPGREVKLDNGKYHVGAIYDPSPNEAERWQAYDAQVVYYHCERCEYIAEQWDGRDLTMELLRGETEAGLKRPCPKCQEQNPLRSWFRPTGFAHVAPEDDGEVVQAASYATAAKLVVPTPDGLEVVAQSSILGGTAELFNCWRAQLLVINEGARREGFIYCPGCGRIEPEARLKHSAWTDRPHSRPYPVGQRDKAECVQRAPRHGVALGFEFPTDVCLLRVSLAARGIRLTPRDQEAHAALRTACEAIAVAATRELGLQPGEIAVDYRWGAAGDGGSADVEIYVFDRVPGGAGFSFEVGRRMETVLAAAADVLSCGGAAGPCTGACYHCVKSYSNRFNHNLLERHLGRFVLDALLGREVSEWIADEKRGVVQLIAADLAWQARAQRFDADVVAPRDDGRVSVLIDGEERLCDAAVRIGSRTVVLGMAMPFCAGPGSASRLASRSLQEAFDELTSSKTPIKAVNVFLAERNQPAEAGRIFAELKLGPAS